MSLGDDSRDWSGDGVETRPGAWLVYAHDRGPYAIALHDSAETAARQAARQGYGSVAFWPFGTELSDAIQEWEGRP